MKIIYDPEADALYIRLRDGTYLESDEVAENIVFDYDAEENVLGIEILFASEKIDGYPLTAELRLLADGPKEKRAKAEKAEALA